MCVWYDVLQCEGGEGSTSKVRVEQVLPGVAQQSVGEDQVQRTQQQVIGVHQVITNHREVPWKDVRQDMKLFPSFEKGTSELHLFVPLIFYLQTDYFSLVFYKTSRLPLAWTNRTQQKLKTSVTEQG